MLALCTSLSCQGDVRRENGVKDAAETSHGREKENKKGISLSIMTGGDEVTAISEEQKTSKNKGGAVYTNKVQPT